MATLRRVGTLVMVVMTLVAAHIPAAAASSAPYAPYGSHLVDMKIGDEGQHVAALQGTLTALKMYRGEIDGKYGNETAVAVMALHKYLGIDRTWAFDQWDWFRIVALPDPGIPDRPDEPDRIEIDFGRQLLFLVLDGEITEIVPVSGGGNYIYWSERNQRDVRAGTPRGDFKLKWFRAGWREDVTTGWWLYNYWAFTDYYGIHGYSSVPAYPASHGCIRVNTWESDHLTEHFYVGMPVHIWDVMPVITPRVVPDRPHGLS